MIELDGRSLTLAELGRVARDDEAVALGTEARERVQQSRAYLEEQIRSGARLYGVNTGFGRLAESTITPDQTAQLQENLVRSHASGIGRPLPPPAVRAIMALRANALARGLSGCRPEVVDQLVRFLNEGLHPVVPSIGSVGASGDLAPLAHVALALTGGGTVQWGGRGMTAAQALTELGMEPLELREKEGLALINGTQATTGLGALAYLDLARLVDVCDVAGAMSLEALLGTPDAFLPEIQEARPHPGQIETAARLRHLLRNSEIRESHRHGDPRVQDPYSLRCMPQIHGATRDVLGYARGVLEIELNSATDNPLVIVEAGAVVSGGNFHAQVVAQALDFLCIAAADLAAVSERRIERLLNPDLSGLPAFLARSPGLESGFMIAQVTAADLIGELRVLAHPASVDSIPTSAAREDHVSMGMAAGRKLGRVVECLEGVLAIELLCAAEGLEHRKPLQPGLGVAQAYARVRDLVEPLAGDRPLTDDIESIRASIRRGDLDVEGDEEPT